MLLRDKDIKELLDRRPTIIRGLNQTADPYGPKSPLQPASVDLSIGKIYLPEVARPADGSVDHPKTEHYLKAGHTAIVETAEDLNLPNNIAAIGFPPASVSSRGLLMTNPGHVDPGYSGSLSFTVINMGREPFWLRRGDLIVTMLFFELGNYAQRGYAARNPTTGGGSIPGNLEVLSADFLDVERRATEIAKKERFWTIAIPVVSAIISGVLTLAVTIYLTQSGANDKMRDLSTRIEQLRSEEQVKIQGLDDKIHYSDFDQRLKKLEAEKQQTQGTPSPGK